MSVVILTFVEPAKMEGGKPIPPPLSFNFCRKCYLIFHSLKYFLLLGSVGITGIIERVEMETTEGGFEDRLPEGADKS